MRIAAIMAGAWMAQTLLVAIFCTAATAGVSIHSLWQFFGLVPEAGQPGGTAPSGHALYLSMAFTLLVHGTALCRSLQAGVSREEAPFALETHLCKSGKN